MQPVVNKFTTAVLGAPADWEPQKMGPCDGLPVHRASPYFYSWWKPTWRERFQIMFGRHIRLAVVAHGHPPVHIDLIRE